MESYLYLAIVFIIKHSYRLHMLNSITSTMSVTWNCIGNVLSSMYNMQVSGYIWFFNILQVSETAISFTTKNSGSTIWPLLWSSYFFFLKKALLEYRTTIRQEVQQSSYWGRFPTPSHLLGFERGHLWSNSKFSSPSSWMFYVGMAVWKSSALFLVHKIIQE